MTSIEGNRGEPRPRPPFPAVKGLFGKPTILNNVETYANIAQIILKGADWFASMGTEKSKGTKVFALGGKIVNTGLVEITDKGVKVKDLKTGKESEIAGDSVIMSVGYIPTPVAKDGVKLVGDCNGIGNLRTVIWRAWDVAMKL